MYKIVDGFSGKGGAMRRGILENLGYEYITFDIDGTYGPTFQSDIMEMKRLPEGDVYSMSVPCESFSVSSIGHHWNKDNTPKTEQARRSVELVKHTLYLLEKTGKPFWIENPRGKLRKLGILDGLKRNTITYCQYGDSRMKPTDIWYFGFEWEARPMCKNGDPCHVPAPRGSRTGTQGRGSYADKSIVPTELWLELLEAVFTTRTAGER